MHSNSSVDALRAAAELVRKGADLSLIHQCLFSYDVNKLRLWGAVLEKLHVTDGISISGVTSDDLRKFHVPVGEVGSVVDYLNSVQGADFSMFFSEDREKSIVKCSTRTNSEDIDLASFCKNFGGGGHRKAAGFRLDGALSTEEYFRVDSAK